MISLESIPIVSWILKNTPHLDYEGQRLAEKIYHYIVILFSLVGVVWGYFCQQFEQTVFIIIAGFILASVLVLVPWPMYRRNPLPWQPLDTPTSTSKPKKSNSGGGKGNNRKK